MNQETKQLDQPHSVKISINAKGLMSAECKCYGKTPDEALTECTRIAKDLEATIKLKNNL